jgi:hypothetical protein
MAYLALHREPRPDRIQPTASPRYWDAVWRLRYVLALVYVVACGIRGSFPRQDGERGCMFDHPLSLPLVGRCLACVAELSFVALACATTAQIIRAPFVWKFVNLAFCANVVAQSCCNYAIITRDQFGHVVEQSIWTATAAGLFGLCLAAMCCPAFFNTLPTSRAQSFLWGVLLLCPFYVLFMVFVDVPMYYHRALANLAAGRMCLGFWQGIAEISACAFVTQADAFWMPELPWMSLYFSLCVWVGLWMAAGDDDGPADAPPSKTVTRRLSGSSTPWAETGRGALSHRPPRCLRSA